MGDGSSSRQIDFDISQNKKISFAIIGTSTYGINNTNGSTLSTYAHNIFINGYNRTRHGNNILGHFNGDNTLQIYYSNTDIDESYQRINIRNVEYFVFVIFE